MRSTRYNERNQWGSFAGYYLAEFRMLLKGVSGGRARETLILKWLTTPDEVVLSLPKAKLISEAYVFPVLPHFSHRHVPFPHLHPSIPSSSTPHLLFYSPPPICLSSLTFLLLSSLFTYRCALPVSFKFHFSSFSLPPSFQQSVRSLRFFRPPPDCASVTRRRGKERDLD